MSQAYNKYLLLADGILLIHFALVAFVVLGFIFIWTGHLAKWKFVRNAKFRICHALVMGIVLCESLFGIICPLTEWENDLRIKGGEGLIYEKGFIHEWIQKIMFYDFSEGTFMVLYLLFFAFILVTFRAIPPDLKKKRNNKPKKSNNTEL
ncbi:MAG: DUF2784 domain-containing protein [Deltaproteobacteria bacterium]|nr:DUF2784 domain-containing protein [Deltaproteobacteria bacterium]